MLIFRFSHTFVRMGYKGIYGNLCVTQKYTKKCSFSDTHTCWYFSQWGRNYLCSCMYT